MGWVCFDSNILGLKDKRLDINIVFYKAGIKIIEIGRKTRYIIKKNAGLPLTPLFATKAASNPKRAEFPQCNGFDGVPAFAKGAPAKEAAMANACVVWRWLNLRRFAAAATLPITPTTAG